jgi:hypothetical protein
MRHHGGAQDRGGQQHAFGAAETRHQSANYGIGRWRGDEETGRESDRDDEQQAGDDTFEKKLPTTISDHQQQQRNHPGDDPTKWQGQTEQDPQRDRPADYFGHIGCHRHDFGLRPKGQPERTAHLLADRLGQRTSGHQPEFCRQVLHQAGHYIGCDDDPQQEVAELRAGADVSRDVSGIDIGDRGDERRPEQIPARLERGLGALRQRIALDPLPIGK